MQCSKYGTGLSIDIRIALVSLGRDAYDKSIDRMSIAEKKEYLRQLRAEQRSVGGILKEGV
jgi:hypothetical protein